MKKLTIAGAIAVALSSMPAMSENFASQPIGFNIDLNYQYQDNMDHSLDETNQYGFGAGYTPYNWLELDLRTDTVIGDNRLDSNRLEGSATVYYGFTDMFGAYGQADLGQLWTNSDDFAYGAVGVGGYLKPYGPTSNTQIKLGYRYRDSFDDVDYETNSLVLGAEYAITNAHSVTVGYEYVDGVDNDLLEQNLFSVGYRGHF